jgi:thiamine phosphate synthase YjbQ (UPF0047 family)
MTTVEVPFSVAAVLPTLSVFDVTHEVQKAVAAEGVTDGLAYVSCRSHRSLIRVTEREAGFFCDFEDLLGRLVGVDAEHREHVILMLLGARTEAIPLTDGRLCLGQWQRVLLFGFAGDTSADFLVTVLG